MSANPLRTIIVQYGDLAGQWVAHFDGSPQIAFGSDLPMGAVRRLLEGSESPPSQYELHVDQDQVGSAVLLRVATWQPPELIFQCPACEGRGQHIGLLEVETCKVCHGRKVVAG